MPKNSKLPPLPPPARTEPEADWQHRKLWTRVKDALAALPVHFRSDTFIEGINATDIFTLNAALGATIENQVVETLNQVRSVWDPGGFYETYAFVRQPQSFPDVVLRNLSDDSVTPLMGIEMKGWYLLAKEGEPSLRFTQTADACAAADLIMVVPWVLSNVISGRPRIHGCYIESAKYMAGYRNYYWQVLRDAKSSKDIVTPKGITPYPSKAEASTDKPESDGGGNFGRIARTGIMDTYMARVKALPLCGIRASYWLDFFKMFSQDATEADIARAFEQLRSRVAEELPTATSVQRQELLKVLQSVSQFLERFPNIER
jgi:hypothetical protein